MPKLDLKAVQRELDQEIIWPVYCLYGPERWKVREIFKKIQSAVLGSKEGALGGAFSFQNLEGDQVDGRELLEAFNTPCLAASIGGGAGLIVVREAQQMKNPEAMLELLGPPQKRSELFNVCVLIFRELDGRKKFSKALIEKAGAVPCEEVPEAQRESWISFLAKRRGVLLGTRQTASLCALDPWSLESVEQEIEKIVLVSPVGAALEAGRLSNQASPSVSLGDEQEEHLGTGKMEFFLENFFDRDLRNALPWVSRFAEQPAVSLPLLGLMSWTTRQLTLWVLDREQGGRSVKLSPSLIENYRRWGSKWRVPELVKLQEELAELDYSLKQTPLLPLGVWTGLVTRFCPGE